MSAFTEEQQAVLRQALHHVWSRMGTLHDDLSEDTLRLASAIAALSERGLLTPEEMERIARRGCTSRPASAPSSFLTM
jgi:hypothetical protein